MVEDHEANGILDYFGLIWWFFGIWYLSSKFLGHFGVGSSWRWGQTRSDVCTGQILRGCPWSQKNCPWSAQYGRWRVDSTPGKVADMPEPQHRSWKFFSRFWLLPPKIRWFHIHNDQPCMASHESIHILILLSHSAIPFCGRGFCRLGQKFLRFRHLPQQQWAAWGGGCEGLPTNQISGSWCVWTSAAVPWREPKEPSWEPPALRSQWLEDDRI